MLDLKPKPLNPRLHFVCGYQGFGLGSSVDVSGIRTTTRVVRCVSIGVHRAAQGLNGPGFGFRGRGFGIGSYG